MAAEDLQFLAKSDPRRCECRSADDHRIIGIKRAWYATQNLASVFGGGVWETEGCDDSPGEPDFCATPSGSIC